MRINLDPWVFLKMRCPKTTQVWLDDFCDWPNTLLLPYGDYLRSKRFLDEKYHLHFLNCHFAPCLVSSWDIRKNMVVKMISSLKYWSETQVESWEVYTKKRMSWDPLTKRKGSKILEIWRNKTVIVLGARKCFEAFSMFQR